MEIEAVLSDTEVSVKEERGFIAINLKDIEGKTLSAHFTKFEAIHLVHELTKMIDGL